MVQLSSSSSSNLALDQCNRRPVDTTPSKLPLSKKPSSNKLVYNSKKRYKNNILKRSMLIKTPLSFEIKRFSKSDSAKKNSLQLSNETNNIQQSPIKKKQKTTFNSVSPFKKKPIVPTELYNMNLGPNESFILPAVETETSDTDYFESNHDKINSLEELLRDPLDIENPKLKFDQRNPDDVMYVSHYTLSPTKIWFDEYDCQHSNLITEYGFSP